MNKNAPHPLQLVLMVLFALSSFGLLLFLWTSFGGSVPLRAEPYTVRADFKQGTQLAGYADVRISGVTVGKATNIRRDGKVVRVSLQMEPRFAPLPKGTRATLRSKTLVGETFVALSFGDRDGPKIPDGGRLAAGDVEEVVELDDILDVFDGETRPRFQALTRSFSRALRGRGNDLYAAAAQIEPTLDAAEPVLRVLDRQSASVRAGIRDLGTTFSAIGAQQAAIGDLIVHGRAVTSTTAGIEPALRATVRALPAVVGQAERTLVTARRVAGDAAPVLADLRPVVPLIQPTLRDLRSLAPDLRVTLDRLGPTLDRFDRGFPALTRVFDAIGPLMDRLDPLTDLTLPALRYLSAYHRELGVTLANAPAATQPTARTIHGGTAHMLRMSLPLNSDSLVGYTRRHPNHRDNPYPLPGGLADIGTKGQLAASDCSHAGRPPTPLNLLLDAGGAPACRTAAPFSFDGRTSAFPNLVPDSQTAGR
ncbi:MAG: MlaD family protein [Solirubrobacteraceae bacterium]